MNRRGIGLVELIGAALVGGTLIVLLSSGLRSVNKTSSTQSARGDGELNVASAYAQIMEAGRLAQRCWKGVAGELFCNINTATPPLSAPDRQMRFLLTASGLSYEEQTLPGVWTQRSAYPGISAFTVCNDADMAGATPTCALLPSSVSIRHTGDVSAAVGPTGTNRFFRFRLQQRISERTADTESFFLQGAFYVRAPVPTPLGSLVYQWGSLK